MKHERDINKCIKLHEQGYLLLSKYPLYEDQIYQ
jgi:hypothetical protein